MRRLQKRRASCTSCLSRNLLPPPLQRLQVVDEPEVGKSSRLTSLMWSQGKQKRLNTLHITQAAATKREHFDDSWVEYSDPCWDCSHVSQHVDLQFWFFCYFSILAFWSKLEKKYSTVHLLIIAKSLLMFSFYLWPAALNCYYTKANPAPLCFQLGQVLLSLSSVSQLACGQTMWV